MSEKQVADFLLAQGWITQEERAGLVTNPDGSVFSDEDFPVDICDNGDVYIHNRGAYPILLKNFCGGLS